MNNITMMISSLTSSGVISLSSIKFCIVTYYAVGGWYNITAKSIKANGIIINMSVLSLCCLITILCCPYGLMCLCVHPLLPWLVKV